MTHSTSIIFLHLPRLLCHVRSLAKVIQMHLEPFISKFESISTAATKEYSLDRALSKMIAEWQDIEFSTSTYR